ncbi:YncE family protein [Pedobacter sp. P351]|uniref:YncE family protein n=1 Tax=Pedobacter superstes TaxID=3133441 RepID=UPI00309FCCB4
MKAITVAILLISSVILLGCKKMNHDMDDEDMGMNLNINYSAAYVVNGQDASVSVIDLSKNAVTETIPLMGDDGKMAMWPHHIYKSPISNTLSVAIPGTDLSAGHAGGMADMNGMVMLLDAQKGSMVKNLELPAMNHNATFSPDGKEIWTSQMEMEGKVLVYDAQTYMLKKVINVGMEPAEVTFSANGTKAYVANGGNDNVMVINPVTKERIATIPVGDNPVAAWVGQDNRMYVDNEDGQSVSVIDVTSNTVVQTIPLGFMPGSVAHNAFKNELWVTDPDNGKVHYWTLNNANAWVLGNVFSTGLGAHAIAFTKNGETAYVTNQQAKSVSVVNVQTHAKTKDIPVGNKPNGILIINN